MITILEHDLDDHWFTAASKSKTIGCDIETSGLDKWKDQIACIQVYVPDTGTVMVRNLAAPENLMALLENPKVRKVFHYAMFDLSFIVRDYPRIEPVNIADTKVAVKLVDPKKQVYIDPIKGKGSHSLRSLVFHHFGYLMDKSLAISDWFSSELSNEQLEYAAKDVEYLPALLFELENQLRVLRKLRLARKAYKHIPVQVALDMTVDGYIYGYD